MVRLDKLIQVEAKLVGAKTLRRVVDGISVTVNGKLRYFVLTSSLSLSSIIIIIIIIVDDPTIQHIVVLHHLIYLTVDSNMLIGYFILTC
ncbi:hypothetical protein VN97_g2065 [Penicillium thymicola]|uniref:Uncharacterized protein n=1 Tax=Penicillium thymicola TaxID=293382 RepID=A0AAI9XC31_PENTH|nr:hypothetical protein VN97_g2065 [Penicillium thymicola]